LASVLLDSDDVFKQVSVLSGGERAKLGLCLMEGVDANFLILDEPTNHLDLDAREALEDAICAYGGTVLFVSHDRYFVNRIAQRVLEISDYKINEYEGNYDSYAEAKRLIAETLCSQSDSVPVVKQTNKQQTTYRTSKQRATDTKRKLLLTSLEKQLEESELRISTLESEMSTPEIANDYQLLIIKSEEYTAEKLKYDELTEQYLVLTTD
ncbi:MAG: ABC transporter, partial [Clostridia bacterium]